MKKHDVYVRGKKHITHYNMQVFLAFFVTLLPSFLHCINSTYYNKYKLYNNIKRREMNFNEKGWENTLKSVLWHYAVSLEEEGRNRILNVRNIFENWFIQKVCLLNFQS